MTKINQFELFDEKHLFQFIQWEDSEPHNISELIKEYEYHNEPVKLAGGLSITQAKYDKYLEEHIKELENESEETEVKKDKEWAFIELGKLFPSHAEMHDSPDYTTVVKCELLNKVYDILSQLDEPEVLSEEWIDENKFNIDTYDEVINVDDLQNLLVPKQELPVIPKFVAEWIEEVKPDNSLRVAFEYIAQRKRDNYDDELAFWVEEGNSETFARAWLDGYEVEVEQRYYVMNNDQRMMLVRMMDGKTITEADPFKLEDLYEGEKESHRLTEQEIKGYDPRYWAFRKPVEELKE